MRVIFHQFVKNKINWVCILLLQLIGKNQSTSLWESNPHAFTAGVLLKDGVFINHDRVQLKNISLFLKQSMTFRWSGSTTWWSLLDLIRQMFLRPGDSGCYFLKRKLYCHRKYIPPFKIRSVLPQEVRFQGLSRKGMLNKNL